MRQVASGPKEEPYNLWLGAELLIDLKVRRGGTHPLRTTRSGMLRYAVQHTHEPDCMLQEGSHSVT
jgi:hypothetical protein